MESITKIETNYYYSDCSLPKGSINDRYPIHTAATPPKTWNIYAEKSRGIIMRRSEEPEPKCCHICGAPVDAADGWLICEKCWVGWYNNEGEELEMQQEAQREHEQNSA
jgi:hypothetical protein